MMMFNWDIMWKGVGNWLNLLNGCCRETEKSWDGVMIGLGQFSEIVMGQDITLSVL